jgi:hypothetical protein
VKDIKWVFVLYAIGAAVSMLGVGVAIGERSIIGILCCIVLLIIIMGFGFKSKKKWREEGRL